MSWELTGNAGTNPSTNFLGTTDSQPLVIKTGGSEAMRISNGEVGIGGGQPLTLGFDTGLGLGGAAFVQSSGELRINPFVGSGTSVSIGFKELGHSKLSAALTVVPLSSQVGMVIGQPDITKGGFTSLSLSISDDSGGHAIIQAIKSSGSAFGDLILNPDGGNVGIGISTPGQKLTVNGVIESTAGFKYPDGSLQTTATLKGDQGIPGTPGTNGRDGKDGMQGKQGLPGPPVKSVAVCVDATTVAGFCNCSGGRQISSVSSPCNVTSDTGPCHAISTFDQGGFETKGSCCVCAA